MASWKLLRPLPALTLHLAATNHGICRLALRMTPQKFLEELSCQFPECEWSRGEDHPLIREATRQLNDYFHGDLREFRLPLDLRGTRFQRRVWQALQNIPYGKTRSYGDIAREIGLPKASRAVGGANRENPVAIVVPCHRVVSAAGTLGGFACGLDVKRMLLDLEARAPSGTLSSESRASVSAEELRTTSLR